MKTFVLMIIVWSLLLSCSSSHTSLNLKVSDVPNEVQYSSKSVVTIKSSILDRNLNRYNEAYTGVIIHKDGFVLTTSHGLSNFTAQVHFEGEKYPAEVIYDNKTFDFAILKINTGFKLPFIKIAPRESRVVNDSSMIYLIARAKDDKGPIYTKGYLQARDLNLSSKEVDWYSFNIKKRIKKNYAVQNGIIHNAHFQRGYSGSPLVNQMGELIGVNSAGFGKKEKGMALAQEINCFIGVVGELRQDLNLETKHCNIQIDLESSEERIEWVLQGLQNHFLLMGFNDKELDDVREQVAFKAQKRLKRNTSKKSRKKTIAWAWKEFVKKIEDK
jgi:S1-C subfamily serine protease